MLFAWVEQYFFTSTTVKVESIDKELDLDLTLWSKCHSEYGIIFWGWWCFAWMGASSLIVFNFIDAYEATLLLIFSEAEEHCLYFSSRVFLYYLKSIVGGADIVIKGCKLSWQMPVWSIVASVEQTCDLHICRFDIWLHLAWAAPFSTLDFVTVCNSYKLITYVLFCPVSATNWWNHFLYAIYLSSANHCCPWALKLLRRSHAC